MFETSDFPTPEVDRVLCGISASHVLLRIYVNAIIDSGLPPRNEHDIASEALGLQCEFRLGRSTGRCYVSFNQRSVLHSGLLFCLQDQVLPGSLEKSQEQTARST